jgi:hypothetical protein
VFLDKKDNHTVAQGLSVPAVLKVIYAHCTINFTVSGIVPGYLESGDS